MLTQEEIKKYAHMRRLKLLDQIWKDYFQDLLLYLLYKKMPKMVFGGGTSIWKIMNGDRFSEDIDAYAAKIPEDLPEYIKKEISFLGVNCTILKKKRTENMLFLKLSLSFASHPREIVISFEVLTSQVDSQPARLYPPYPDMPPFDIFVLLPEELLANKISAIYGRNKSRDVHDLYFLLKSGTKIDMQLIRKKVPAFGIKAFEKKLAEKRKEWQSLRPLIVTKLPSFEEEYDFVLVSLKNAGLSKLE